MAGRLAVPVSVSPPLHFSESAAFSSDKCAPLIRLTPDPILSANLFCSGRLDQLIHEAVWPFWQEVRRKGILDCYSWIMRYARGGEHLKIRVHGPPFNLSLVRQLLVKSAQSYLCRVKATDMRGVTQKRLPPIDLEDRSEQERPDCTFLQTRYQRSPISLGAGPLLSDETYLTLITRCLGAGCELILESLHPNKEGMIPYLRRQAILFRLLTSGLNAIWSSSAEWEAYIEYHRDWAVRFPVLSIGAGIEKAREILMRYDREADVLGVARTVLLRNALESQPDSHILEEAPDSRILAWRRSIRDLYSYLVRFDGDPEYDLDPVARGPHFPCMVKVFNGVANQLGINALNEGLAHHILLRSLQRKNSAKRFVLSFADEDDDKTPSPESDSTEVVSFNFEEDYRWMDLVATFDQGAPWVQAYWRVAEQILTRIQEAVGLLRQREFGKSHALLSLARESRRALRRASPSIFHVIGRFCYAGWAYYYYCLDEFDQAARLIGRSGASIRAAVERESFLLPFATLFTDIPLKRAHIARARHRWVEMRASIAEVRALMADRQPLCVLRNQATIYHSTIGHLIAGAPGFHNKHCSGVRYLLDSELRSRVCEHAVRALCLPPGFLIPYP